MRSAVAVLADKSSVVENIPRHGILLVIDLANPATSTSTCDVCQSDPEDPTCLSDMDSFESVV